MAEGIEPSVGSVGDSDDNVLAAHTLRLSGALLAAGRPHSVLPLSGVTHMTPQEVNSLQGLAQKFGGSLTQNPHTGLPEAGFLDGILPMLGGALLSGLLAATAAQAEVKLPVPAVDQSAVAKRGYFYVGGKYVGEDGKNIMQGQVYVEVLAPKKLANTLAFMFETRYPQRVTSFAAQSPQLQDDYMDCWNGLKKHFDPKRP